MMSWSRTEFLSLLNEVKPALAGKGSEIVGLDAVWFKDGNVHAYDGIIQIRSPLSTLPLDGGVPGDILIRFLNSCATDNIEIDAGGDVTVIAGKSRIKLPLLDVKQSACEFPDIDVKELGIPVTKEFTKALDRCLISVHKNSAREAYSGVLIEPAKEKGTINLFATDNKSLTWENIKGPTFDDWEPKLLLPGEFCSQLLRLVDDETFFLSDEGYAVITTKEGVSLTTRLLDTDGAPRYDKAVQRHLSSITTYYPIPDTLRAAVERCELIKPDRGEDPMVIDIKKGQMLLSIDTPTMRAKDEVETQHPDIRVVLDSGILLRALPNYTEFAITDDCVVLHGEGTSYHMISTMEG